MFCFRQLFELTQFWGIWVLSFANFISVSKEKYHNLFFFNTANLKKKPRNLYKISAWIQEFYFHLCIHMYICSAILRICTHTICMYYAYIYFGKKTKRTFYAKESSCCGATIVWGFKRVFIIPQSSRYCQQCNKTRKENNSVCSQVLFLGRKVFDSAFTSMSQH